MGQRTGSDSVGALTKVSGTSVQLSSSRITVGGQQYYSASPIVANLATTGFNGLDTGALAASQLYYCYAVVSGTTLGIVASLSASAPTGFSVSTLVGRFNTDGSSQVDIANNQAAADDGKIGHTASAMLTEAQFRAIHGAGWILMDGRNVSGSKYHQLTGNTTVPDARGRALIGAGQGSGLTNRTLGSTVGAETHTLTASEGPSHTHRVPIYNAGGGLYGAWGGGNGNWDAGAGPIVSDTPNTSGSPHNNMQPSIALNRFIKIN